MKNMPQFEEAVRERIVDPLNRQSNTGGKGVIIDYNREEHTATVLMARPGSNTPGETIKGVMCPVYPGIQQVDPEVGRPCWVSFRDGTKTGPVITAYYSPNYPEVDRRRQNKTNNATPRFLMEL